MDLEAWLCDSSYVWHKINSSRNRDISGSEAVLCFARQECTSIEGGVEALSEKVTY